MANGFQLPSAPRCIWAHGKASGHLKGLQGPDVQSHVSIKVGDNKHWPWVTQCGPNCSHHWVLTLFVEEKTVYLYSQGPVQHNLRSLCQQFSNFYKLHISYSLALYLYYYSIYGQCSLHQITTMVHSCTPDNLQKDNPTSWQPRLSQVCPQQVQNSRNSESGKWVKTKARLAFAQLYV
jgi:hypothetical protein